MNAQTILRIFAEADAGSTDPNEPWGGPGTLGFVFIFFIAALTIVIIFDMVRRLRKVRYRAEIQERLSLGESADQNNIGDALAVDWRETTTTKSMPIIKESPAKTKPQRPDAPPKPSRD
ncbi:MAG: hypothetical protein RLZ28_969 [Actinomycetota bacterium]|jgi:hypothetical protein